MNTKILLAHRFNRIGWFLLIPSLVMGFPVLFFEFQFEILNMKVPAFYTDALGGSGFLKMVENNVTDELVTVCLLLSSVFVAFSKEKEEDEYVTALRLESLLWSVYLNYFVLLLTVLFFYEFGFMYVMILNMFTTLFFFIVRFNVMLYKIQKS
jgi:hypothetical protein